MISIVLFYACTIFCFGRVQVLDDRFVKLIIGFALQTAIVRNHEVESLSILYFRPSLDEVRRIHDRLFTSTNHFDREIAILLEPLVQSDGQNPDPKGLVTEMREMEFLLYTLINRAGEAQREINDWMNYIANAAESLSDGYWTDTKVLLSQAVEISCSASIESLKLDSNLTRELDILQRATRDYFQEMRKYPLRLVVPEERLEATLKLQETVLDLLKSERREDHDEDGIVGNIIRRLNTAIRLLINEKKPLDVAREEIKLTAEYLDQAKNKVTETSKQKLLGECSARIHELMETNWLQLREETNEKFHPVGAATGGDSASI
jgi:hypothetical protein